MSDLISRAEALALPRVFTRNFFGEIVKESIDVKLIEQLPSARPTEIVRCKDCKHYEFADNRAFGMPTKYCDWFGFEDVDDEDFCSRAERR